MVVHAKVVDIVRVAHFVGTLGGVEHISGLEMRKRPEKYIETTVVLTDYQKTVLVAKADGEDVGGVGNRVTNNVVDGVDTGGIT